MNIESLKGWWPMVAALTAAAVAIGQFKGEQGSDTRSLEELKSRVAANEIRLRVLETEGSHSARDAVAKVNAIETRFPEVLTSIESMRRDLTQIKVDIARLQPKDAR